MLAETYCGTSTRDRAVPRTSLMARVLIVQGPARSRADTAATLRAESHEVLEAGRPTTACAWPTTRGPRSSCSTRCCPTAPATSCTPASSATRPPWPSPCCSCPASSPPRRRRARGRPARRRPRHRHPPRPGPRGAWARWPPSWPTWTASPRSTTASATPLATASCRPSPASCTSPAVRRHRPHRLLRRRRAPPDAWRDLLDRAEAALARAKRAGRNRCEVA
jgi:hypothetical protein